MRQEHNILEENQSREGSNEGKNLIKEKYSNEIGTLRSTNNSLENQQGKKIQHQVEQIRALN